MTKAQPADPPSTDLAEAPLSADQVMAKVHPLPPLKRRRGWFGPAASVALAIFLVVQLRGENPRAFLGVLEKGQGFWALFVLLYLVQPLADLAIFRRVLGIPWSGFGVLLRKAVLNEVVFGYSGDAYFYAWLKARGGRMAAPFAAMRDVNLLSALAGNVATLVMIGLSALVLHSGHFSRFFGATLWAVAGVLGMSLVLGGLSAKLVSLSRRDLAFVAMAHGLRLSAYIGLTILLWRLAAPWTPVEVWVALMALRLLISRLPFASNKDLLFANLAAFASTGWNQVGALTGTLALATLLLHLAVMATQFALGALHYAKPPQPTASTAL